MGQLDVHDMEFDGVLIPDAVDARLVLEAFEPDVAGGEGGLAGFDKDLGAGFSIAQHDENAGSRVLMHQRGVMGRDMDVEDADPFIGEELVMTGLFADLDLGSGGNGQNKADEEKDGLAHDTI
jgi:hypothetical protein